MTLAQFLHYASSAGAAGLALATAFRAGRSLPRWAFTAGMIAFAIEGILVSLANHATSSEDISQWQRWRMIATAFQPGLWLLFSATYARPAARRPAGWRLTAVLAGLGLLPALAWWRDADLIQSIQLTVWDTQWRLTLGSVGVVLWATVLVSSIWIIVNLERTFRASVGTARWRIKHLLLGIGLIFVVRLYSGSQALLFRQLDADVDLVHAIMVLAGALLASRSLFRTGSFELEVYPSHALLHRSLTVLFAGAYLLIVGVLARVVTYIGGDSAFAAKAFLVLAALVLLAVLLQSDHWRLNLRRFISRNFRRSPYDDRAVWRKFNEGTTSRVEPTELSRELVRLSAETFQALSVGIWLVDERQRGLVRSASTTPAPASGSTPSLDLPAEITARLRSTPEPFDLDGTDAGWAAALRPLQPTQFDGGGRRVCVPILARGDLLGVMILGDRVGGEPFSIEDHDMLKCVADHAGACLLGVQLAQRLLQARELEAFQAMAAFFVHDLKNSASTLNLMLQNLPVHFDDPEFRQDALRGIGKTVHHINSLISRLGALRQGLTIQPAPANLSTVVSDVLDRLGPNPRVSVTRAITPLPDCSFDANQIGKVIMNLVLNSTEAVPAEGLIRVSTRIEADWVVATVEDNGCGMAPEFVTNSLFRPFQTTKKNGLGIGMFQSRMIVEAHGGRLTVQSQPGHDTTFELFLRASPPVSA